jgi:hypothetical protein
MCFEASTSDKTQTLGCDAGEIITGFVSSSFGLPQGTCFNSKLWKANAACHKDVVDVIQPQCLGKSSCEVSADPNVFGTPCATRDGRYRLLVSYICERPSSSSPAPSSHANGVKCFENQKENDAKLIVCPKNEVIKTIRRASFGLQHGSCASPKSWAQDDACSLDVTQSVSRTCIDRESCYVEADPKVFGLPCKSANAAQKQFRVIVDYVCAKPQAIAKSHCYSSKSNAVMSCPSGQTITEVTKGSFGNGGSCAGPFVTGSCHIDAKPTLDIQCLNRDRCVVNATTQVFGTPACANATYGTSSTMPPFHLLVDYKCGIANASAVNLSRYNASFDKTLLKAKSSSATSTTASAFIVVAALAVLTLF